MHTCATLRDFQITLSATLIWEWSFTFWKISNLLIPATRKLILLTPPIFGHIKKESIYTWGKINMKMFWKYAKLPSNTSQLTFSYYTSRESATYASTVTKKLKHLSKNLSNITRNMSDPILLLQRPSTKSKTTQAYIYFRHASRTIKTLWNKVSLRKSIISQVFSRWGLACTGKQLNALRQFWPRDQSLKERKVSWRTASSNKATITFKKETTAMLYVVTPKL